MPYKELLLFYHFSVSEKNYLKASVVAGRYGVHKVTVKDWIKAGYFPNAKLEETVAGAIWLIPETDLENFEKPQVGRPSKTQVKK